MISRPRYEPKSAGRYEFTFDWMINGYTVAEIECAVDYEITFGEDHDKIGFDQFWVQGIKRNPDWSAESDPKVIPFMKREWIHMPQKMADVIEEWAHNDKVMSGISEQARLGRGRLVNEEV